METVVLLFNTCCIYEIVILNYFLHYAGKKVRFTSVDGKAITAMEGYSINVEGKFSDTDIDDVELLVIPGGNIKEIDTPSVWNYLKNVYAKDKMISAICAGVDVLDHAGILTGINSTHSINNDVVADGNIVTARANGYVGFAIETAKLLRLFKDERDLEETIRFWRDHQSIQN